MHMHIYIYTYISHPSHSCGQDIIRDIEEAPSAPSFRSSLEGLRNHALHLTRSSIAEELHAIQDDFNAGEEEKRVRSSRVRARLMKLKPGHCGAIGAIMSCQGQLLTDAKDIAAELQRYWGEIFRI